jgi:hypothetical protein
LGYFGNFRKAAKSKQTIAQIGENSANLVTPPNSQFQITVLGESTKARARKPPKLFRYVPGLPDFSRYNIPKRGKNVPSHRKIYQNGRKICIPNVTKCTKWPQNLPNGRKVDQMAIKYIYQHLHLQVSLANTQIRNLGLKILHLATLICPGIFLSP